MSFGKHAICSKGTLGSVWQSLMLPWSSSRFRRKLFRGQRYFAQTGGTSRNAPRKKAIGDRDGPRSTSLWPRAYFLSLGELIFGAGDHSKCTETNGPLLACSPECRTHYC